MKLEEKLKKLWAKGDGTSIREHTDRLHCNLKRLRELYGESIERVLTENGRRIFWNILTLACEYHDYGKIYAHFQKDVGNPEYQNLKTALPKVRHNLISPAFLPQLEDELLEDIVALLIINHHKYNQEKPETLMKILRQEFSVEDVWYEHLITNHDYGIIHDYYGDKKEIRKIYTLAKGFLLRIDHASSSSVGIVENEPVEDTEVKVKTYLQNKNSDLNDLQRWVLQKRNESLLVVASTGMGKTEAGFLFLGRKGFFILPMKTSANGIYMRAVSIFGRDACGLLHSSCFSFLISEDKGDDVSRNLYENVLNDIAEARNLAKPLIVCTPDQLFPFVFRFYGFEKYLSIFSYAKVVLDEIQLYEPHTLGFIVSALKLINKWVDGKVMVITATLPEFVKGDLDFLEISPHFLFKNIRHNLKVESQSILSEVALERMSKEGKERKVLVVCNTVQRAVEVYSKLKESYARPNLLHARFILQHRQKKEEEIKAFFDSQSTGIWITTQLAEVSLDLDADLLFTELSTVDSLLQRLGRVNRKGKKDTSEPNVFVYVEDCSGIPQVYRKSLFEMTKERLRDGLLAEEEKIRIVEEVYSEEILKRKDSEYLRDYINAKEYIESLWNSFSYMKDSFNKGNAQKLFRDIDSVLVVPNKYRDEVERLLRVYANAKNPLERIKKREEIYSYTVNVPSYWVDSKLFAGRVGEKIYPPIYFINANYDEELGLEYTKESIQDNLV